MKVRINDKLLAASAWLALVSACNVETVPGTGAGQQASAGQESDVSAASTGASLSACQNGDGQYCGGHGCSGASDTLHTCVGGQLTPARVCSHGCEPLGNGAFDRCAPPPPMPACPNGDGQYCGGNGFDGDGDTLYTCEAGLITVTRVCSNGCEPVGSGGSDRCAAPPSMTACPEGDGQYCGGHGFTGNADTLFDCSAGAYTVARACANGCTRAGNGGDDFCEPSPAPMLACPAGDGSYCGTHGIAGNIDTLYDCAGGVLSIPRFCDFGCERLGAGANDRCAAWPPPLPACPSGDGLYCGGHGFTADSRVLHHCVGGQFSVARVCGGGCWQIGAGAGDFCLEDLLPGAGLPTSVPPGTPAPSPPPPAGGGAPAAPNGNPAGAPPPSTDPPAPGPAVPGNPTPAPAPKP